MHDILVAALKRAGHTAAQVFVATIGPAVALEDVAWWFVISSTLLAALISFVKSLAVGMPEVELETANQHLKDALVQQYSDLTVAPLSGDEDVLG